MSKKGQLNQGELIVIGGSAGSFHIAIEILKNIHHAFQVPVILVLHRLKGVKYGFVEALSVSSRKEIIEPANTEEIIDGNVYLAPSSYHLSVTTGLTFALTSGPVVNFSKPSIDVLFESLAKVYQNRLTGILLSGANADGAKGLKTIRDHGGLTIVQNPEDCQVDIMPLAALKLMVPHRVYTSAEIIQYLVKFQSTTIAKPSR